MKIIGNELDSVQFSLKKASQMVKEIGRQVLFSVSVYVHRLICEGTVPGLIKSVISGCN